MPVDTTPVEIRINVVDSNSGEVIARMQKSFSDMGSSGAKAGKQVATGMQEMANTFSAGEGSLRTMNAEIRSLQGSIFGDTRAAAEFLGTIKGVGEAMELAFPIFGATALIGVVTMGIDKMREWYEKWIDVDGAVRKYQETAAKAAEQKLFNDGAMQTQLAMMQELNHQADDLLRKRSQSPELWWSVGAVAGGLMRGGVYGGAAAAGEIYANTFSPGDAKNLGALQDEQFQERLHRLEEQHKAEMKRSEAEQKLAEARMPEYARAGITEEYEKRRAGYEQMYQQRRDLMLADQYNTGVEAWNADHPDQMRRKLQVPANTGQQEYQEAVAAAQTDREAKELDRQRANAEQIRQLQEQALEARLHGEDAYTAKMEFEIGELKRKGLTAEAAINAVRERYHEEQMTRIRQQELATEELQMRAAMAGMTGIGRTQAEGLLEIGRLNADQNLDATTRQQRIEAINLQTHNDILQQERQFREGIDAIADASAAHQISGFARIRADAAKQLDDLQKKFDAVYGHIDRSTPEGQAAYSQGLAQLGRGKSAIGQGAENQIAELARRNAQETEQIEAEARAKLLGSEKQQTAAIEQQYEERLRKYQEQLDQQQISQEDFNRRVAAAAEERDAEMIESAREARQKIAGELRGVFGAHPLQGLQELGSKYAAEAGGAILQRLSTHYGGGAGPESAWDKIAGIPGVGARGRGGILESGTRSAMMTIAQAQISVGSAAIMAGAGAGLRNAAYTPGGFGAHSFGGYGSTSSFGGGFSGGGSIGTGGFSGGGFSGAGGGGGAAGIAGNVISGAGTAKEFLGMMRKPASGLETSTAPGFKINSDGSVSTVSGGNGSMLSSGLTASNAMGVGGGALGLFSAFKTGGFGGLMGGAMSGAQLGMSLGGPIGAGIGAVAGAALGFFGGGEKARLWWLKQGRPRLLNDVQQFENGGMAYTDAYMDLESLKRDAHTTLGNMGFVGSRLYHDTVTPAISQAEGTLNREQRAGRSLVGGFSAAQFAIGADRITRDGFAFLHKDERIVPSDQNERITRAIEGQGVMPVQSARGWMGDIHLHAIDAKSSMQWLLANKHHVRAALNASYGENSGGADASF